MAQGTISLTEEELMDIRRDAFMAGCDWESQTGFEKVRVEERKRAADIVRNFDVKANYVVTKIQVKERKDAIITEIMGDLCMTSSKE